MDDVLGYAGRNVVVTGAASGMGAATAQLLLDLGANVTAIDVNPITRNVGRALQADLRDKAAIEAAAAEIEEPVHAFFGSAGLPGAPFSDLDVMLVNFVGSRYLIELVLPKIPAGGAIAVVASNAAMGWQLEIEKLKELVNAEGFDAGKQWVQSHPEAMVPEVYSFSKKVVNAWVASRAATLITEGKRLNCINPGPTATAMMPHFVRNAGQSTIDAFVGPIGRQATPLEQAWPLVFLNSPRASYVNGETFTTDGGFFGALQTGQVDLSALFAGAGG